MFGIYRLGSPTEVRKRIVYIYMTPAKLLPHVIQALNRSMRPPHPNTMTGCPELPVLYAPALPHIVPSLSLCT